MTVLRMADNNTWEKIDTYEIHDALESLREVPLVVTYVALNDRNTPDGTSIKDGITYLNIRLPYQQIKDCKNSPTTLMKYLLLSQIRHLKHLDWYNLYWKIKKALNQ